MMQIEYDPNLIEQAVFLAVRDDGSLSADLHRATDPVYAVPDQRKRETQFNDVYKAFFHRLGLQEVIRQLVSERPAVDSLVERCFVCEAPRQKNESAELYIRGGEAPGNEARTLFIKVCPQSLLEPSRFTPHMRRELAHVADMLDDDFGYERDALLGHHPRQNLIRDRVAVLWDIAIEGRLVLDGCGDDRVARTLADRLQRVFPNYQAQQYAGVLDDLLDAAKLTYAQLLKWARTPRQLFGGQDAPHPDGHPADGEMCPLCTFSTFDWFGDDQILRQMTDAVQKDYREWRPDHGICRQCAEIYITIGRSEEEKLTV